MRVCCRTAIRGMCIIRQGDGLSPLRECEARSKKALRRHYKREECQETSVNSHCPLLKMEEMPNSKEVSGNSKWASGNSAGNSNPT